MSTCSGGQNDGDVIDKIRELRAILDDAEEHILSSRAIEQESDGMEIVELAWQTDNYAACVAQIR